MIWVTGSNHVKYDMHSVFTIVFPDSNSDTGDLLTDKKGKVKTVELYSDYSTLTPEEITNSKKWHLECAGEVHPRNIVLTLDYFINNCHNDLWTKATVEYKLFDDNQKEGLSVKHSVVRNKDHK